VCSTSQRQLAPGILATTLKDITAGSNGSCSLCSARSGFDLVTGLGSG
jgi:hypothetical protein